MFAVYVPLVVRLVGEDGFGIFAAVTSLFLLARKFVNFGLFEATKTYGSRTTDVEQNELFTASQLTHLAIVVIVCTLLSVYVFNSRLDERIQASLAWMLVALVGAQQFNFCRSVLHSLQREHLAEPFIFIRSLLLAMAGLALASAGYGVAGLFAGFAFGFVISGSALTALVFVRTELVLSLGTVRRSSVRTLLAFGAPSMVLSLLVVSLFKLDVLMVAYLRTTAETGHYRAALQIAEVIWLLPLAMQRIMIQNTSTLWNENSVQRIETLTRELLYYVLLFTLLIIVGITVLSSEFIDFYFGPGFRPALTPLYLLLPGLFALAIARVLLPVLQAGGNLRELVATTAIATAVNVALNVWLIPRFGIEGAAVATTLSYVLVALLYVYAMRRREIAPLTGFPVVRVSVVAATTFGLLAGLDRVLADLLALGLLPFIGFGVYVSLLLLLGLVSVPSDGWRLGWGG